ncbi:MAG: hypothetical protein H8E03_00120 [Pelagibacteraceae bacterium]|nr:hypothetical protein [Pelagibacteraceae bacterium]
MAEFHDVVARNQKYGFHKIQDRKRIPFYHERTDKVYSWTATYDCKGRDGSKGLPFPNCLPDSVYDEFVESGADDSNWWLQSGECKEIPRIRTEQKEPFQLMSHYGFLVTPESEEVNYKAINEQFELQITNKRDEKYVYLIQPQSIDPNEYFGIFQVLSTNIPVDVMEDLSNDRAILCLSFIQEGDSYGEFYEGVHAFCDNHTIPRKNFVFCSNNANLEIEYDGFCEKNNITDKSTMISVSYYYNHVSTMYRLDHMCYKNNWDPPTFREESKEFHDGFRVNTLEKFNPLRKEIRPYHYLSYNRQPKLHRTLMVAYLMKENLLDKGLVSLGSVYTIPADERDEFIPTYRNLRTPIYTEEEKAKIMPYWEKVKEQSPFLVDLKEEQMQHVWESSWMDIFPSIHNKSYFSIVSSTSFDTAWMHPDEKFWKKLGQFHPFIWVGPPHSLQHLRTQGFKTFSPWINESYDDEEDCEKRMLMIVSEIKRLCDMSLEEMHEWYHEMEDILKHNWRRILNYNPSPFFKPYNKLYDLL